jgi:ankyrin repeat protein
VGDSPLHVAIYTNQLEAAAKLREMDHVDCNATNLKGDSPMSLVLQAEHVKFNAIVRR